jgi:hypothetical protein
VGQGSQEDLPGTKRKGVDVIMGRNHSSVLRGNLALALSAVAIVSTALGVSKAKAQEQEEGAQASAVIEPLRPGVTESQVLTELAAHNEQRKAALRDYTSHRTYQVVDLKGKVHAEEVGRMDFRAPDQKTFTSTSERGSAVVRRMALTPLINSEIEAATGKQHHDSAISAANYRLSLLGEQQVGPYHCFVAEAVPRRKEKYLFEGKVWIDASDYSVVRIEGRPATKLSFWIQHADFVRQYQKVDGFWLPQKDETVVQVRLYGTKVLTIQHENYVVNGGPPKEAQATESPVNVAHVQEPQHE